MSRQTVSDAIRRAVGSVGCSGAHFSGISARKGGLSTAIQAGVEEVVLYLQSGHGPERAARRYLQPFDYTRLMATFLAFGRLAAGGQDERYVHARLSVSARRQRSYAPRPVGRGRRSAPAWPAAGRQSRLCLVGGPRSRLVGLAGAAARGRPLAYSQHPLRGSGAPRRGRG